MQKFLMALFLVASLQAGQAVASPVELLCELGQKLSIAGDVIADNIIELGWKGRMYRMQRVGTSTGAHRFEDPGSGLIWVSIPGKAMLLDGRKGQPVANECMSRSGGRSAG